MAESETSTTTSTPTPAGPAVPVVVQGTPVSAVEPQPERAEFMRRLDTVRAFNTTARDLATHVADSDLAYYDDNVANRRYIAKVAPDEFTTAIGTPVLQLRRIPFPADEDLAGVHVLREDGTFYSIPAGIRSLGDVVDPDSGEPLVGEIDPARHKNRLEAAGLGDLKLNADGTVEETDRMTVPRDVATSERGNVRKGSKSDASKRASKKKR